MTDRTTLPTTEAALRHWLETVKPTVLWFPGASLMTMTVDEFGARIRCPGCTLDQRIPHRATGQVTLLHDDACPVHARIRLAMRAYERRGVTFPPAWS